MILTSLDSTVHVAHEGAAAIEVAMLVRPHTATRDIGIPAASGYDVAQRVRQLSEGASCLLIALTGSGQDEDRRRAHEAGFDMHLTKPADPNQLLAALARHARRAAP